MRNLLNTSSCSFLPVLFRYIQSINRFVTFGERFRFALSVKKWISVPIFAVPNEKERALAPALEELYRNNYVL